MHNLSSQFSVHKLFVEQGRTLNIFSEQRRMLALWCANIERTIIAQQLTSAHVFAGFQQLEFFLPVMGRYKEMTNFVENIWIFGTDSQRQNLPLIDGIRYVRLDDHDALTQEWFLIVNHPTYSRSLSALETTLPGTPHKDRTYKGVLSTDPKIIVPVHNKLVSEFTPVY